MKKIVRIVLVIFITIVLIYVGIFIHELGHYMGAKLMGVKVYEIHISLFENSYVRREKTDNINTNRLIIIMGSLTAIIFGFSLMLTDYKIKSDYLILPGYLIIWTNCGYWMCITEKTADAYRFIETFETYSYLTHFAILIFIMIISIIMFNIYIKNTHDFLKVN